MAPPVADTAPDTGVVATKRIAGQWRSLWHDLVVPADGRAGFALRLAAIAALTLAVTELYGTPEAALTVYLAFFLNKPDRVTSVVLNLVLLAVFTLILLIVLGLAEVVLDHPVLQLATMAGMSFVLMFLGSASKLRPLAPVIGVCVVYALAVLGSVPAGEIATRGLLYTWLIAGIPAGVSVLVNLVAAPAPRALAERALARRLRVVAAVVRDRAGAAAALERDIAEGVAPILAWLRLAAIERTSPARDLAGLRAAALSSQLLMHQVAALDRDVPPACRRALAERIEAMAAVCQRGQYPRRVTLVGPDDSRQIADIAATLAEFGVADADRAVPKPAQPAPRAGFFVADAFTSPVHVFHALKVTLAATVCYLAYSLMDWPGIHTCLITCYVVALGSTAETIEKLTLRITGCLMGAAMGVAAIIWVIPGFDSLGGPMLLVFAVTVPTAWIAAGSPRIAYAGFQIAFAFYLCAIQGNGAGTDLVVARDRVIGILFGNAVVWLVFTCVAPVSLRSTVERSLRGLLDDLRAIAATPGRARLALAAAFDARLAATRAEIAVMAYEPRGLHPGARWLARRSAVLDRLCAIEHRLIVDADQRDARAAGDSLEQVEACLG